MKIINNQKYNRGQIDVIKAIAEQNIVSILEKIGIMNDLKDSYPTRITGKCPIHNGDNRTAFSWSYKHKTFKCFTHSCEKNGKDIFSLVMQVKDTGFLETVDYVMQILNININDVKISQDKLDNIGFVRTKKSEIASNGFDPSVISGLKPSDYLHSVRGFSKNITEIYCPKINDGSLKCQKNAIVIPVFDKNNNLIGATCRHPEKDGMPKWMHVGLETEKHLFNLNRAKSNIKQTGNAILCEGPLDVMKFEDAGIANAIGLFGLDISSDKISLLLSSGAFQVILALDRDEAGQEASSKIVDKISNFFDIKYFRIPENFKDIEEMGLTEIKNQYKILVGA